MQRLWLGMVDPVLDCNGWMLDDQSLLPLFKYGEPVAGTDLIRRGDEVFQVGEHFDIDRRGRLYRPHQYTALAGEHEFTQAPVRDKLALPVCESGPRHRFFDYCKNLHRSIATLSNLVRSDGNAGWPAVLSQQMEFERECLSQEEQDDPKRLIEALAAALGSRGMRPAMGFSTAPPPSLPPPGGPRPAPAKAPASEHEAVHTQPPSRQLTIHKGQQDKHIPGSNNYTDGRSILTVEASELLKRAGTGQQVNKIPIGQPGSRERIDFGETIGIWVNDKGTIRLPTTKGTIHYAADGKVHIVPAKP